MVSLYSPPQVNRDPERQFVFALLDFAGQRSKSSSE
jgi:hypothetical protein